MSAVPLSDALPARAGTEPRSRRPTCVGLVVHSGRDDAKAAAVDATAALCASGAAVVGATADGWSSPNVELREPSAFAEGVDVVVALGGDGTFLRAAYLARDRGAPVLGVNLGRLGFLSEVEPPEVLDAVQRIAAGDYDVEERMTLQVEVRDADGAVVGTSWALNEASVERTVPQRLIVIGVRVGDVDFATIPADAVICATPTGSTAYAFSAGGPILSPRVDAILLVPVAPHTLFNRTLVVDPGERLSLRPLAGAGGCVVGCDGRESIPVPEGGSVHVFRGERPVRLARLGRHDFYATVRDKFGLR